MTIGNEDNDTERFSENLAEKVHQFVTDLAWGLELFRHFRLGRLNIGVTKLVPIFSFSRLYVSLCKFRYTNYRNSLGKYNIRFGSVLGNEKCCRSLPPACYASYS